MRSQVGRHWVGFALVLLLPLAIYWPTIFHEYGFRDDYAHLRESREIPGHLVRFTSSYGRPAYGALLVASVRPLNGEVKNLQWLRLGSAFLLGFIGLSLALLLQRSGWTAPESFAIGSAIALLPAAQVTVSWSIAWPLALAVLLSVGGFAATTAALSQAGRRRVGAWAAGFSAYLVSALIYQPSALFFVVPLAAALLLRMDSAHQRLRWTAAHLATALGGLATGFVLMRIVFALGILKHASVIAFESDPLGKLAWFISMPVANSLALFPLRDRFDTPLVFWASALVVTALIAAGFAWRLNRAPIDRWTALFCLLVLPFVAFAVNLAAALRMAGYRTTYALAGLVVVFVVYALRSLREAGRIGRGAQYAALGLLIACGAATANRNAFTLVAQPQGWEWRIVLEAAARMPVEKTASVYAIRSSAEYRATQRMYADEFGSLSSDTEWAVSEMLKCALRRRFASGAPTHFGYTLKSGFEAPRQGVYDLVIDMRKLARYRPN